MITGNRGVGAVLPIDDPARVRCGNRIEGRRELVVRELAPREHAFRHADHGDIRADLGIKRQFRLLPQRDAEALGERDSYAKHLKDIERAADAGRAVRPDDGGMQSDPNNRDNAR